MTAQIIRYRVLGFWLRSMILLSFSEQAMAVRYLKWRTVRRDARIKELGALYEATSEHLRDLQ